jgi:hypothetical protein
MTLENNKSVDVMRYTSEKKKIWDDFVSKSKNGTFLFYRDYMEYHSDRFQDCSFIFLKGGTPVALLPANIKETELHSHEGLTYGGIISNCGMNTPLMLEIFDKLVEICKSIGIKKVLYKPIPYIYQSIPSDEDLYALFRFGGKLVGRNLSSCIYQPKKGKFSLLRRRMVKKAKQNSLCVKQSEDFPEFIKILEESLFERHKSKPVHSLAEIQYLAEKFPNNIKLFASYKEKQMLAGFIVYESDNVAHGQYAGNSKEGWNIGAQDIIEDYLINEHYKEKKYFDFGTSTSSSGKALNVGLISRKESFSASAVMYDIYELQL